MIVNNVSATGILLYITWKEFCIQIYGVVPIDCNVHKFKSSFIQILLGKHHPWLDHCQCSNIDIEEWSLVVNDQNPVTDGGNMGRPATVIGNYLHLHLIHLEIYLL